MNRLELIASIAEKSGITKKDAETVLSATIASITEALKKGDKVQIISGPLEGFEGIVLDENATAQKAKVKVAMFNTETEVEVDFIQLKIINN